jgi:hypothetical protein
MSNFHVCITGNKISRWYALNATQMNDEGYSVSEGAICEIFLLSHAFLVIADAIKHRATECDVVY